MMQLRLLSFIIGFIGLAFSQKVIAQQANWSGQIANTPTAIPALVQGVATVIDDSGNVYVAYHGVGPMIIGTQSLPAADNESSAVIVKYSSAGAILFVKRIRHSNANTGFGMVDIELDSAGNIVVLGALSGQIEFDNGVTLTANSSNSDYFLAKFSDTGNLIWAVSGGGSGKRYVGDMAINQSGEIYFTGYAEGANTFGITPFPANNSRAFLAKYSSSGLLDWVIGPVASSYTQTRSIDIDQAGRVYISGFYYHYMSWGNQTFQSGAQSEMRTFTTWFTGAGQILGHYIVNQNAEGLSADNMKVDANGFSYISGKFAGTVDLGGITLVANSSYPNTFIAKYDPSGSLQWANQFEHDSSYLHTNALAFDGADKVYLTGIFADTVDFAGFELGSGPNNLDLFLVALDAATGTGLWAKQGTSQAADRGFAIAATPAGQVVLTGGFEMSPFSFAGLSMSSNPPAVDRAGFLVNLTQQYNAITGHVFLDMNSNGQQDTAEGGYPDVVVAVSPGTQAFVTEASGAYTAIVGQGAYSVLVPQAPLYYNTVATGSTNASFTGFGNSSGNHNFALQPIPNQQDLQLYLTPLQPARPGFPVSYRITYKNPGTVAIPSGTVSLTFDPLFTYLSSTQTATQSGNALTWSFGNLEPLESHNIDVLFSLTALAPLGGSVSCTATITPLADDLTPANNTETITQTIVGSFDPNSIEVNHQQLTLQQLQNGQKLNYTIRFQNMGTDTAFTVMLRDSIPAFLLNLGTIELVSSSHSCTYTLNAQGILTVLFTNIRLPHQGINSIGSNGFVRFQIKPFQNLAIGDIIPNAAHIYFDYNTPITTNTAETEVVNQTGTADFYLSDSWELYPNPATEAVRVKAVSGRFAEVNLRLLNALGQEVCSRKMQLSEAGSGQEINLRHLPSGVYTVQLQTEQGSTVKRLVKQ